jgi:hypothetical protein
MAYTWETAVMEYKPDPHIRVMNQKIEHPRFDPPRPLTQWEQEMLDMITCVSFPGHEALRRQINHTRVEKQCGCGCLTSDLVVDPNPDYRLEDQRRGPIYDLYGKDNDGMVMYAILFVRDGYLSMLEVQRADGSPFKRPPDPMRFLDTKIAENQPERDRLEEARRVFRRDEDYVIE